MEDRSGQVIAVAVTFFFLTWLTVGLRCYVRTYLVKAFGLDDKVMVLTLVFYTAYLSCQLGGAAYGTGQRRAAITDANAQTALHFWFFCEIFYTVSTSVLKIAVGFFLLRITVVPTHIWIIRIIMIVSAIVGSAYTILVIFQCKPISYWWDLDPSHTGTCLSTTLVTNFTYVVSALNSFADWTFGILPIFIVKDLQMRRRVKVVVASVIALAAIGSTATIVRLPYTSSLTGYKGELLYRTTDFAIWTTVEVGVGITAGCMATLRPLFKTTLGSTGQSVGLPWSKESPSKLGDSSRTQPLDTLRSAVGKSRTTPPTTIATKTTTTTTVTGGRSSSESDEESFLAVDMPSQSWDGGIKKSVTTTVIEERPASQLARGRLDWPTNKGRSYSPGGESGSTLGGEMTKKPVRVHESV